jgi:hypothetical protein
LTSAQVRNEFRYARDRFPVLLTAGVMTFLLAFAALAWLFVAEVSPGGDSKETAVPVKLGNPPRVVSDAELATLSSQLQQPIYWVGPRAGTRLEVTLTRVRHTYVRYLPTGAIAGDPSPRFMSVRNYPVINASGSLRTYAAQEHVRVRHTSNGGLLVIPKSAPNSVYVAYPGQNVQVQLYVVEPGRALRLAMAGAIQPVA